MSAHPTPCAVPEYYIQKWELKFSRAPNPLGQSFQYNVRCVWTSCSSSVPLAFSSRKQKVKFTGSSYSTFCNKICTCRVFYRHKANLVCIKWRNSCACNDSRKILSNRNSIFTQIATTWFVARQVWTWVIWCATSIWHTYRFIVAFVSGRQDLPSDERAFSLTSFEHKAFYCGWIRVLIFSKVPSGSD